MKLVGAHARRQGRRARAAARRAKAKADARVGNWRVRMAARLEGRRARRIGKKKKAGARFGEDAAAGKKKGVRRAHDEGKAGAIIAVYQYYVRVLHCESARCCPQRPKK